jgi:hypothetical protein
VRHPLCHLPTPLNGPKRPVHLLFGAYCHSPARSI